MAAGDANKPSRWFTLLGALTVVGAVIAVVVWRAGGPAYRGPVQHVIVISLDTARPDHFGCYGNPWVRTPRIDALAAESIRFENYITVATSTLASHVSLFTGKYPHHHGVPRNGFMVHPDNVMLAEILKEAGFATAAFLGAFSLSSRFGFAQAFEHVDERFDVMIGTGGAEQNQRDAAAVTDAAIAYLDAHGVADNLFLFVHYFDPHMPYAPPPPYDALYGDGVGGGPLRIENHPALARRTERDPSFMQQLFRYAGEHSYMDEHVGRLLDDLRRRGILDKAIVIVTSDHGENLGEQPDNLFQHGWTTYQFELDAVCLIRLPGGKHAGQTFKPLTASIDIVPTLTQYLGLPAPPGVDGEPLDLTTLAVASDQPRVRFGEATKPWEDVETDPRWRNIRKQRCVRVGRYKLVQTPYLASEELYDLTIDPYERNNLLGSPTPAIIDDAMTLRQVLRAWTAQADPLPSRFEDTYEDTLRRLKALGYVLTDEDEADVADQDADAP